MRITFSIDRDTSVGMYGFQASFEIDKEYEEYMEDPKDRIKFSHDIQDAIRKVLKEHFETCVDVYVDGN